MNEIIITRESGNFDGMIIEFYKMNDRKFQDIRKLYDYISEIKLDISYTQLKYIVAHRTIPKEVLIKYPDFIYEDKVSGIETNYPNMDNDYDINPIICRDKIHITIIQLINGNNDIVGSAYQYNDKYCTTVRELYDSLTDKNYLLKYGELRWILANLVIPTKMKLRFPNFTISVEKKIKVNARTIKYASDFEVLSKKGHHTLSAQSLESKEIEFKPSDDKFEIIRLSEDNYSLNGEELGISDELLKKLNILGVDITRPQFRMIIGHKRIPKSLLENYPNMTYVSNI